MNELETLQKQKDNAYWERNQLVAALSKLFPASLAKHDQNDKEWDADWRTIVYIALPVSLLSPLDARGQDLVISQWRGALNYMEPGKVMKLEEGDELFMQISWHIHDTEIPMFDHLKYQADYFTQWDGHTTEEKYRRLRKLLPKLNVVKNEAGSTSTDTH